MTNNRVRIGVVGTGSIALRGILPHLTQEDVQDRLRVTAVCDPVPGRAQAAAEKFGVPAAFENYEDLLAAGDVDAVTLASPPATEGTMLTVGSPSRRVSSRSRYRFARWWDCSNVMPIVRPPAALAPAAAAAIVPP